LTFGDEYISVPAVGLPKSCIVQLSKAVVVGYKIEESDDTAERWLPCYVVKTLEIYLDRPKIENLGEEHSVNRWWVEQGNDAYTKVFGERPREEFVFR